MARLSAPRATSGFGTRLFQRALEQFEGKVETAFEPSGLVCRLSVVLAVEISEGAQNAPGANRQTVASG